MAVQNTRLWRQPLRLAVIAMVVIVLVQRATLGMRFLSGNYRRAPGGGDLSPLAAPDAPGELMALVDATNAVMVRLDGFVGNAAQRTSCARRWQY